MFNVTPEELKQSIFNRLQVIEFAEQSTIDDPHDADKVQSRAANVQKQIRCIAKELSALLSGGSSMAERGESMPEAAGSSPVRRSLEGEPHV